MSQCPNCDHTINDDATQCPNCGQSLTSNKKRKNKSKSSSQSSNDNATNLKLRRVVPIGIIYFIVTLKSKT